MPAIKTRVLLLSDTHADPDWAPTNNNNLPSLPPADVAIHCGDLTEESKLAEFIASLTLLKSLPAPLKLVIPGNHDVTLDDTIFRWKIMDADPPLEPDLVDREFGDFGEARRLFEDGTAREAGVVLLLEEGRYTFTLDNGAVLRVWVSPFTPSINPPFTPSMAWLAAHMGGFQYTVGRGHDFSIPKGIDIVVTHGPPSGVLDMTADRQRAGCPELFAAVARARPRVHCFGHIHEGWGAKKVVWRGAEASERPSHFTDVDNERSAVVESLATLRKGRWDSEEVGEEKERRLEGYMERGYVTATADSGDDGLQQTLFVNAAIQGLDEGFQFPWVVEMELPVSGEMGVGDSGQGKAQEAEGLVDSAQSTGAKRSSPDERDDAERPVKRKRGV